MSACRPSRLSAPCARPENRPGRPVDMSTRSRRRYFCKVISTASSWSKVKRAGRALPNERDISPNDRPVRLKLIVAYDGAAFNGWQSQTNRNTIQDHIETAFARITGQKIRVHGAGRTDAGVHALGQCAHVDLPPTNLKPVEWTAALNASLPVQIRIMRCRFVPRSFHARFSARGKIYRYRIWTAPVFPPFEVGRAW